MCDFKSLKMRSRFASFWLVEIWNGAFWLVGRLLSPGASRENPLLSLKRGALWSRAVSPPGGATCQLWRRFWLVESRHVTYDVTAHLHKFASTSISCTLLWWNRRQRALRFNCADGYDGSRSVTWLTTSQSLICISRDLSMEAAILFAAMLFCDDTVTKCATSQGQMCRRFCLV